jgi:hypothetical protein
MAITLLVRMRRKTCAGCGGVRAPPALAALRAFRQPPCRETTNGLWQKYRSMVSCDFQLLDQPVICGTREGDPVFQVDHKMTNSFIF